MPSSTFNEVDTIPKAIPIMIARLPAVVKTLMIRTVRFSIRRKLKGPFGSIQLVRATPANVRPSRIMNAVPNRRDASRFFARNARNAAEAM